MAATGAVPVRVAQVPSLSGGSKVPAMVCRSLMARPSCSAGRVRVKAYQGSSSTLSACMRPWRTAR